MMSTLDPKALAAALEAMKPKLDALPDKLSASTRKEPYAKKVPKRRKSYPRMADEY